MLLMSPSLFKYIVINPNFIKFKSSYFWPLFTLALTERKILLSLDCHHSSVFTYIFVLRASDGRGKKGLASTKIVMLCFPQNENVSHFSLVFPFLLLFTVHYVCLSFSLSGIQPAELAEDNVL